MKSGFTMLDQLLASNQKKSKLTPPQFFTTNNAAYRKQQQENNNTPLFAVRIPEIEKRDPIYAQVYEQILESYQLQQLNDKESSWSKSSAWVLISDITTAMNLPSEDLIFDIEWKDLTTTQRQLCREVDKKYSTPDGFTRADLHRNVKGCWVEVKPYLMCEDANVTMTRACEVAREHGCVKLSGNPEWVRKAIETDNDHKINTILNDEFVLKGRWAAELVYDPKYVKKLRNQQAAAAKKKKENPKINFEAVRWLNTTLEYVLTSNPQIEAIGGKFVLQWKKGGKRLEQLCDRIVAMIKIHRAITGEQSPWRQGWKDRHLDRATKWEQRHCVRLAMQEVSKSVPLMLKYKYPSVKAVGRLVQEQLKIT